MYVLYLDESGTAATSYEQEKHFVLAGVAVPKRQIYHLIRNTDDFVSALKLGEPHTIELHYNPLANKVGYPWKQILERSDREKIIKGVFTLLADTRHSVRFFAVAVEKSECGPKNPVECAFKEISIQFNAFLKYLHNSNQGKHRGLIVMDELGDNRPNPEKALQKFAHTLRKDLPYLPRIPYFENSKSTRLIQLADFVAHAIWREYQYSQSHYLKIIANKFGSEDGVIKGLVHHKPPTTNCPCPAHPTGKLN